MERAVLITGTSSGIGAACAHLLADAGFTVFAGVRRETDGAALSGADARIHPLILDVTDSSQIAAAADMVERAGIPLAGVISNAGVTVPGPLEILSVDDLRAQYDVNVFGAYAVVRALIPQLRVARGRVVFIGSIGGRLSIPFLAPYASSKAALRFIADALRMELHSSGIGVSLIEPGGVRTPIWEKGRAQRERLTAGASEAQLARYAHAVATLTRISEREERTGMPPERIARIALHALTASRPQRRYVVGRRARLQAIVALLPPGVREGLLTRLMRIS